MKQIIRVILTAIAALALLAAAALAAGGSSAGTEGDPLVTLSYINEVFTDYVTGQFRASLEEKTQSVTDRLESRLSELEAMAEESGGAVAAGETYEVVTLSDGQKLICQRGTELLLRVGSARVVAGDTPGLVDTSTTGNLENGESLTKNHMYLVTINGHGIRAEGIVKIVARGEYEIQ